MKNLRTGVLLLCGVVVAACGETVSPESQLSQLSASEELVSETMVSDVESMSDRAEFRTDVANRDRVCDISEGTIAAAGEMVRKAGVLSRYLHANYVSTASAGVAPTFTALADELYVTLQRPASCWTVVQSFLRMARAGRALGANLHEEGLLRRDDRLGVLVRSARTQFVELKGLIRKDLASQVTDRRVSDVGDRPASDRPASDKP